MAYSKHTWVTNELITDEKMNHIEDGIKDMSSQLQKTINDIINNDEELANALKSIISNYAFSFDANNNSLVISLKNT